MILTMKTNLLPGSLSSDGSKELLKSLNEIGFQLARIADMMEGLRESTNPLNQWDTPDDETIERLFYTDEDQEIIASKLRQMGREYKPSTQRK